MGMASSKTRLSQMPEASIASSRSQLAVAGLAAIIQLKLKGVATRAMMLATADTLTDRAVLPWPKWVTTLLRLPPGQAATRIMAASTLGGRSSSSVAPQVPTGSRMNCGIRPHSTAQGVRTTRRKSSTRNSSATEKTMVASTRLRTSCCVLMFVFPLGGRLTAKNPRKIKGLRG